MYGHSLARRLVPISASLSSHSLRLWVSNASFLGEGNMTVSELYVSVVCSFQGSS